MKVLLGLGNPEQKYNGTRHNVGFLAIDRIAAAYGAEFKSQSKLQAAVADITIAGERILLVKPTTYYNEVGQSARAIMDFYKLAPEDFLLIHDDLALPLGTIRTRLGGSDGGSNGLKSLAAHIGTNTARMRVGVWTDSHHGTDKVGVVLGKFTRPEQAVLDEQTDTMLHIAAEFIADNFTATTHR